MTEGLVYALGQDAIWRAADKDSSSTATGTMAIALGNSAGSDGMLVRGIVFSEENYGELSTGDTLYVGDNGVPTVTAPTAAGDYVRILGQVTDIGGQIWFDPDKTYVLNS